MKKFFPILIFALLFLVTASSVFAQAGSPGQGGGGGPGKGGAGNPPPTLNVTLDNPFDVGDDLFELIEAIVNKIILPIGGVLCVLAFIYSGFLYVTAGGDTTKIGKAHIALLYSAIGTAILLGAWAIATVIRNTINELI